MKFPALLMLCFFTLAAHSAPINKPCTAYFLMVEQDEYTLNLKMAGLNRNQLAWLRKDGEKKDYSGICPILPDPSGKRVSLQNLTDASTFPDTEEKPVYIIVWKTEKQFVTDNNGGHFIYPSSGILYKMGSSKEGDLIPIQPIHDFSRTIFSDTTVSLLKVALKEMKSQ